jgi:hypothetical protein
MESRLDYRQRQYLLASRQVLVPSRLPYAAVPGIFFSEDKSAEIQNDRLLKSVSKVKNAWLAYISIWRVLLGLNLSTDTGFPQYHQTTARMVL